MANCPECSVPYCSGCGRCHACGAIRFSALAPCDCGFPLDPTKVAQVERSFNLSQPRGCLGLVALFVCGSVVAFSVAIKSYL